MQSFSFLATADLTEFEFNLEGMLNTLCKFIRQNWIVYDAVTPSISFAKSGLHCSISLHISSSCFIEKLLPVLGATG